VPPDIPVEDLAERVEISGKSGFVAAATNLDVVVHGGHRPYADIEHKIRARFGCSHKSQERGDACRATEAL
jgi:hypothetical protein